SASTTLSSPTPPAPPPTSSASGARIACARATSGCSPTTSIASRSDAVSRGEDARYAPAAMTLSRKGFHDQAAQPLVGRVTVQPARPEQIGLQRRRVDRRLERAQAEAHGRVLGEFFRHGGQ